MIGPRTRRRRPSATTVMLIVFGVTACEDPQPPATCGAIPQVTVHAGETSTAKACFNDPNGDMLAYSAMSTNPGVATASISGTTITVSGVAPGNASIAVTATDPGGLQAQQSIRVTVPNRAPLPRGMIPPTTIRAGETTEVDVSSYFTEPDGEALAYGAVSPDSEIATVSVTGSTVTVTAVADGTTTVTVMATDPGGLTATQWASVTVAGSRAGFRDDFHGSALLAVWELEDATSVVSNGVLELTRGADAEVGWAVRDVSPNVTSWTIKIRMGNSKRIDGSLVGVRLLTGHDRFRVADFLIGDFTGIEANYSLAVWDAAHDIWFVPDNLFGYSSAINDGAGELTTIRLSSIDGRLEAVAGNTELFSMKYETNHTGYTTFRTVLQVGLVSRSEVGGENENTALFDWIDVNGFPLYYRFLTGASKDLTGIDALALARKEMPAFEDPWAGHRTPPFVWMSPTSVNMGPLRRRRPVSWAKSQKRVELEYRSDS